MVDFVFKGGVGMNDFSVEVNNFLYFSLNGFLMEEWVVMNSYCME